MKKGENLYTGLSRKCEREEELLRCSRTLITAGSEHKTSTAPLSTAWHLGAANTTMLPWHQGALLHLRLGLLGAEGLGEGSLPSSRLPANTWKWQRRTWHCRLHPRAEAVGASSLLLSVSEVVLHEACPLPAEPLRTPLPQPAGMEQLWDASGRVQDARCCRQ